MMGVFVQLNENSRYAQSRPVGYIIQENGCWEWVGSRRGTTGYAQMVIDHRNELMHRMMYARARGPIPKDSEIDHLCRNRGCVNPAHLEAVSHRTNVLRGTSPSGRNAIKTHCPRGHALRGNNLARAAILRGGRNCRTCGRDRMREQRGDPPIPAYSDAYDRAMERQRGEPT